MTIILMSSQGYKIRMSLDSLKFRLKLQRQGLTVKLYEYDSCLYVLVESDKIPEQGHAVELVCQALKSLLLSPGYRIYIYGRSNQNFLPDWVQAMGCKRNHDGITFVIPSVHQNEKGSALNLQVNQKSIFLPSPGQKLNPKCKQLFESIA